jgi:hypothetical protein
MVGVDGTVWIRMKSARGVPGRWLVLDPAGRHIATVIEPTANTYLMSIDHGVWGVVRDSDNVQSVVRFRAIPG